MAVFFFLFTLKLDLATNQSGKEGKESRESNRATQMIISVSLLYFAGNVADSLDALIELFGVDLYDNMPMYVVMGNVFLFGSHGLYIFIYYTFDKQYNQLFQRLILRRTKLTRMPGTEASESTAQRRSASVIKTIQTTNS